MKSFEELKSKVRNSKTLFKGFGLNLVWYGGMIAIACFAAWLLSVAIHLVVGLTSYDLTIEISILIVAVIVAAATAFNEYNNQ